MEIVCYMWQCIALINENLLETSHPLYRENDNFHMKFVSFYFV